MKETPFQKRLREECERQGLTNHENWWPSLYREYCRVRGEEPDPAVLAYAISYQQTRADLKELSVSG